MKPVRRSGRRPQSTTPVGLASSTYDGPSEQSSHHRLHPIQSRRISDSQQQLSRSTGTFSPAGARQSPVGRAYTTPAVPPPVPANLGNAIAGTAAATAAPVMPTFGPAASRSSASSAASGSTAPTSYASSLADQGRRVTSSPKMEPLSRQTTPPQTSSPEEAQHENQTTPTQSKPRILPGPARRASKTTRFVELETFTSQFDSTFELPELRPIDSSSSSGGLRKFKSSGSLQPSMLPPPHLQQSDLPQRQHTPTPAEQQLDGSPTSTATARRPSWTAASSPIVPAAPMPAPAMVPIVSSHPPPPPEPASSERAQSKQPSSSATVTTPPPSRGKLQKKRSEKDLAKQNSREEKQKDDSKKAPVAKKSSRWSLFKSGGQTAAVAG